MNRAELYAIVEGKVDEMFLAYQNAHNIQHGDIYPTEALVLDDLQEKLTDLIISVNQHNMPTTENTSEPSANDPLDIGSRLGRITAHAQRLQDEETRKREAAEQARLVMLEKVNALQPRIQRLIMLANACRDANIKFPEGMKFSEYGYGHAVFAEGIYHHTGFMGRNGRNPITHLGIYAGGFCGTWNFYTNGIDTFDQDERNSAIQQNASTAHMNQFLGEFEAFETAFLKWIDSLA